MHSPCDINACTIKGCVVNRRLLIPNIKHQSHEWLSTTQLIKGYVVYMRRLIRALSINIVNDSAQLGWKCRWINVPWLHCSLQLYRSKCVDKFGNTKRVFGANTIIFCLPLGITSIRAGCSPARVAEQPHSQHLIVNQMNQAWVCPPQPARIKEYSSPSAGMQKKQMQFYFRPYCKIKRKHCMPVKIITRYSRLEYVLVVYFVYSVTCKECKKLCPYSMDLEEYSWRIESKNQCHVLFKNISKPVT